MSEKLLNLTHWDLCVLEFCACLFGLLADLSLRQRVGAAIGVSSHDYRA